MKNIQKNAGVIALVAIVIAIGGYFYPQVVSVFGSVGTRFPNGLAVGSTATVTQNKLTVGNSGTAVANLIFGNCSLTVPLATVTASTTWPYDCAVTGITSSSRVIAQFASSSAMLAKDTGWAIEAANGSTTAGYLTVILRNNTGATGNPSVTGIASSTNYIIVN